MTSARMLAHPTKCDHCAEYYTMDETHCPFCGAWNPLCEAYRAGIEWERVRRMEKR